MKPITLRGKRTFQQQRAAPVKLPPEANPWWWNPSRPGVRGGPEWFTDKLTDIDRKLGITWNGYKEQWQIWMQKPTVQHPICKGWVLLFAVHPSQLDNRVFARLFEASGDKWGNAKEYFISVQREYERDRERSEKHRLSEVMDSAMESFTYSQIKNIGKGSKFADYHNV